MNADAISSVSNQPIAAPEWEPNDRIASMLAWFPETTTIIVRTPTGFGWASLCNTRTQPCNEIDTALDQLMWNMLRTVPSWGA